MIIHAQNSLVLKSLLQVSIFSYILSFYVVYHFTFIYLEFVSLFTCEGYLIHNDFSLRLYYI